MTTDYGTIIFEGKEYTLTSDADFTNRMLPVMGYNDKDENDGKYNFEMRADAVDATGKPYRVYWIFANVEGRELEDYDYNNIDRVEEENL